MIPAGIDGLLLRFGAFEFDLKNNELRRAGVLIRLSPQQSRVLRYLAEHADRICTREEIQREIWGAEVFVDFDRGLNVCIAQIRSALNDDSDSPRFIQTVPRRGYRFVAPVEQVGAPIAPPVSRNRRNWLAIALALAMGTGAAIYAWSVLTERYRTMLAVLPFENVTQAADDTALIDGVSDELITQFGTILPGRLGVIGRTSVLRYRGRNPDLPQIRRDLRVDYVIEGGVRREAGRVRISVRLVRVADQAQTWNETYEQDASNRLELQEQLAARVTAAVVRQLFPRNARVVGRPHVPVAAAYDAFVRGRYLLHKNSRADTDRAIPEFEEAGTRDPAYAEPWAFLALAYVAQTMSGGPNALDNARAAAEHALRIEEANAEAHDALANIMLWRDWNWNEAQRHFQRALAINPSDAQAHHDYAFYLVITGHPETGIASLRRAIALDPLSPRVNVDAGWVLLQAHHFDEAIAQARRALELEPGLPEALGCIARAEQYRGNAAPQALDFYRAVLRNPDPSKPYNTALALAVLGHNDEAMRALQTAYEQHALLMPLVRTEPAFAALHSDARFRGLLRKLGLPE